MSPRPVLREAGTPARGAACDSARAALRSLWVGLCFVPRVVFLRAPEPPCTRVNNILLFYLTSHAGVFPKAGVRCCSKGGMGRLLQLGLFAVELSPLPLRSRVSGGLCLSHLPHPHFCCHFSECSGGVRTTVQPLSSPRVGSHSPNAGDAGTRVPLSESPKGQRARS